MNIQYLDLPKLAEYTQLSKSTLYKKVMNRLIPHIKVGGKLLFKVEEVDAWLAAQRQATADEIMYNTLNGLHNGTTIKHS